MKTKIKIMLATMLSVISIICLNGCSNTYVGEPITFPQGESYGKAEVVLAASLPETSGDVSVYKIIYPDITVDIVAEYGKGFGFFGEAAFVDAKYIAMSNQETNEIFQINAKTGALEYTSLDKLFQVDSKLPSNDEAESIAIEYLKEVGLWYLDITVEEVVVGGSTNGIPSHLLVRFTRTIDGIPVTGPGNKFSVRIGDQGEVIRVLVWHPELEPCDSISIIKPSTVFENFQSDTENIVVPFDCECVEITEFRLGYYLSSIEGDQEYVLPVYIFEGKCLDCNGEYLQDYLGWTEAFEK